MATYHLYSLQLYLHIPFKRSKLLLQHCNLPSATPTTSRHETDVRSDNTTNGNVKFHQSTKFTRLTSVFRVQLRQGKLKKRVKSSFPLSYNVGGFKPYFFATSVWAWAASQREYR